MLGLLPYDRLGRGHPGHGMSTSSSATAESSFGDRCFDGAGSTAAAFRAYHRPTLPSTAVDNNSSSGGLDIASVSSSYYRHRHHQQQQQHLDPASTSSSAAAVQHRTSSSPASYMDPFTGGYLGGGGQQGQKMFQQQMQQHRLDEQPLHPAHQFCADYTRPGVAMQPSVASSAVAASSAGGLLSPAAGYYSSVSAGRDGGGQRAPRVDHRHAPYLFPFDAMSVPPREMMIPATPRFDQAVFPFQTAASSSSANTTTTISPDSGTVVGSMKSSPTSAGDLSTGNLAIDESSTLTPSPPPPAYGGTTTTAGSGGLGADHRIQMTTMSRSDEQHRNHRQPQQQGHADDDDDNCRRANPSHQQKSRGRRAAVAVPPDRKDSSYYERRKKNNESARRSREARAMKESFVEGELRRAKVRFDSTCAEVVQLDARYREAIVQLGSASVRSTVGSPPAFFSLLSTSVGDGVVAHFDPYGQYVGLTVRPHGEFLPPDWKDSEQQGRF